MKVSIVCPFYNEEAIIGNALTRMIENLEEMSCSWELIVVNDGSTDEGAKLVKDLISGDERVKLVDYEVNRGRGYALRQGIRASKGEVVVTTEIDLSWGDTIVQDILNEFKNIKVDVVVASPNLKNGGYKNVPFKRVLISKLGNILIRFLFTTKITMNTGMTRGYKREVIQSMDFDEDGKEFHLESLLKLFHLGFVVHEVPAILEWKDNKLMKPGTKKRKSSTNIPKVMVSHLKFAVFANPVRYFWTLAFLSTLVSIGFMVFSVYSLVTGQVAIYYALVSFLMGILALSFFSFGVLTAQNNKIMQELWRRRRG